MARKYADGGGGAEKKGRRAPYAHGPQKYSLTDGPTKKPSNTLPGRREAPYVTWTKQVPLILTRDTRTTRRRRQRGKTPSAQKTRLLPKSCKFATTCEPPSQFTTRGNPRTGLTLLVIKGTPPSNYSEDAALFMNTSPSPAQLPKVRVTQSWNPKRSGKYQK